MTLRKAFAFGLVLTAAMISTSAMAELVTLQNAVVAGGQEGVPDGGVNAWDQTTACADTNAPYSVDWADFPDYYTISADDFVVPDGESWDIDRILVAGVLATSGDDAPQPLVDGTTDWVVIEDNGGTPQGGAVVCGADATGTTPNGSDVDIAVGFGSCVLSGGSYWLSVVQNKPLFVDGDQDPWGWASNDSTNGAAAHQIDQTFSGADACRPEWGTPTCIDLGSAPYDLCFGINKFEAGGDDGSSVPAVGSTGIIVMLLLMMAASVYFLRRRATV